MWMARWHEITLPVSFFLNPSPLQFSKLHSGPNFLFFFQKRSMKPTFEQLLYVALAAFHVLSGYLFFYSFFFTPIMVNPLCSLLLSCSTATVSLNYKLNEISRAYARKKGRNNVTVDDLIHVITPKGRGKFFAIWHFHSYMRFIIV